MVDDLLILFFALAEYAIITAFYLNAHLARKRQKR